MSYCYYLVKVERDIINKVHFANVNQFLQTILNHDPDIQLNNKTHMPLGPRIFKCEDLFKFGSNDIDIINIVKPLSLELFVKKELNEYYKDYNYRICNKKTLLAIIEYFRNIIVDNFKNLLNSSEKDIKNYIEDKVDEWDKKSETLNIKNTFENEEKEEQYNQLYYPYDLSSNNKIVSSWLYEYEIFELVHILKTFDWENYNILFFGI